MPRFDPVLGLMASELRWVPTPSHIIRRAAILDALAGCPPGKTLEMGCGSGAFLFDLKRLGFRGRGVETSGAALAVARQIWRDPEDSFSVGELSGDADRNAYDYLMAFEVLEHIRDDASVLSSWVGYLKKGGTLVFSVPAHRHQFGAADAWAGHERRYDLADIEALVAAANCEIESVRCYGFPLLNLLQPLSNFAGRRKMKAKRHASRSIDAADATAHSGVDRALESKVFWLYGNFLSKIMFRLACSLQRRFYNGRRGTGYLVVARKR
jgi:SAM-dependent methyltransferase